MADERTQITELGTAAGMLLGADHHQLDLLEALEMPGIPDQDWRPTLDAATDDWHRHHAILRASLANGAAFRAEVLDGRDPVRIEWRGGSKAMWVSDAPVDLRVNDVYLVSAKYDSVCLLNRAPAAVFDHLLESKDQGRSPNWYATVAPVQYHDLYESLVAALSVESGSEVDQLPATPAAMTREHKVHLKYLLKPFARSLPSAAAASYLELCRVVSDATCSRWSATLHAASEPTKLAMLAQMIRLSGNVYWLLGQAGDRPVRCKVKAASDLRATYRLRRFDVTAPTVVGQPRVDWEAHLEPRRGGSADEAIVRGLCEIRWSHGKFQGSPECKVQLRTPVWELPGYEPLRGGEAVGASHLF